MAPKHKIKAYLYDNVLTDDSNDLSARVSSERSLNVNNVSESAATRGGADISAASMTHAVNLWLKEMAYRLCDGFSINTGWFTASAHIRGVFNSPTERFNSPKHTLMFSFSQGLLLRREAASVEVQILGVADASLSIAQVTDIRTGSVNDLLTPTRNLRITGSRLRIAGDNPACGIFFIDEASGARTGVDAEDIVTNNPSELIIVIPDLQPGMYRLEIVTQYTTGGNVLKEPKTALFDRVLTV
jgi:hypothetical protein